MAVRGLPPPRDHDAFPPCFRFPPYFRKIFGLSEFFYNFTFSRKISSLSSAKISDDFFLVINHKFRISSYFRSFSTFPPVSRKLFFPPYFYNFPPVLGKFTCFLHTLRVFRSPYFDHDAFMHHPMHVLDAPGNMSTMAGQHTLDADSGLSWYPAVSHIQVYTY